MKRNLQPEFACEARCTRQRPAVFPTGRPHFRHADAGLQGGSRCRPHECWIPDSPKRFFEARRRGQLCERHGKASTRPEAALRQRPVSGCAPHQEQRNRRRPASLRAVIKVGFRGGLSQIVRRMTERSIASTRRNCQTQGLVQGLSMLLLKPGCECCDADLAADSIDARICSFECTFCAGCAERLSDRCPNCGGDLVPRPIRPASKLGSNPPSTARVHKPLGCARA